MIKDFVYINWEPYKLNNLRGAAIMLANYSLQYCMHRRDRALLRTNQFFSCPFCRSIIEISIYRIRIRMKMTN